MQCANPKCGQLAHDVFAGTLWLVEQDVPSDARIAGDDEGFPVCVVPTRYLWLCPACSTILEIRSWTAEEIILGPLRGLRKPVSTKCTYAPAKLAKDGFAPNPGDLLLESA